MREFFKQQIAAVILYIILLWLRLVVFGHHSGITNCALDCTRQSMCCFSWRSGNLFRARYWRKYHCSAFLVAAREFYCLHSNDWTCEHDLYCHFRMSHNLSRSRLLRVPLFQSKETWIYKEGILFSRLNLTSKLFSSGFLKSIKNLSQFKWNTNFHKLCWPP